MFRSGHVVPTGDPGRRRRPLNPSHGPWLDDEFQPRTPQWAAARPGTFLVPVDARKGIGIDHLDRVLALLVLGGASLAYLLRSRTFDRRSLWRADQVPLRPIHTLWAITLLAASVEHALYGMLVFSVGLGRFFFHGAVQT